MTALGLDALGLDALDLEALPVPVIDLATASWYSSFSSAVVVVGGAVRFMGGDRKGGSSPEAFEAFRPPLPTTQQRLLLVPVVFLPLPTVEQALRFLLRREGGEVIIVLYLQINLY